jgi:MFS family permease
VPEDRTGTGVGVFRFCGDVGFTLGPVVAGLTTTAFGFEVAFAVAVITVIALLLALRSEETLSSARAHSRNLRGTALKEVRMTLEYAFRGRRLHGM